MHTPSALHIPIAEIFVSPLAEQALHVAGISAETIAERFSRGAWDYFGPGEIECKRAMQYRQPIEAAFVLTRASRILLAKWQDGFLDLVLELEDE